MDFVDRKRELAALESWWQAPHGQLGMLWGRRRVGKSRLLACFAEQRKSIFHTAASRPSIDELRALSAAAAAVVTPDFRDLRKRPLADWVDAVEMLAEAAASEPLLLVLDEFPELVLVAPELPSVLRAVWDRVRTRTRLKILLCGSAVRSMEAMQEARAPLYGRLDLSLPLHPFEPHEAALMLPRLKPSERALVWGLVGGVPLYLEWWDQSASLKQNLARLVCTPGGRLLNEGELLLATEASSGDLTRQVLHAIASGRTKHNEVQQAVRADPTRTLDRLVDLRLVERQLPVTESGSNTRRRMYRICDNFLAFWLTVVDRYRTEIAHGLGESILDVLVASLDDFLGARWEEAFRSHLRRLAVEGALGPNVVSIGSFWTAEGAQHVEIDAVVLAGRDRAPVAVGEAKWAKRVDGGRLRYALERKAESLPDVKDPLTYIVCAREQIDGDADLLRVTAADIFA
ncbi:MAG: ATP-binding protein [Chloroflexota bacterium]